MSTISQFGEVLDAVNGLPLEDQQALVEILRRRIIERRRRELRAEIEEAREEIRLGRAKAVTVDELMDEINS